MPRVDWISLYFLSCRLDWILVSAFFEDCLSAVTRRSVDVSSLSGVQDWGFGVEPITLDSGIIRDDPWSPRRVKDRCNIIDVS